MIIYQISFKWFQKFSIKIMPEILKAHAMYLLSDQGAPFHGDQILLYNKNLYDFINIQWIYAFNS